MPAAWTLRLTAARGANVASARLSLAGRGLSQRYDCARLAEPLALTGSRANQNGMPQSAYQLSKLRSTGIFSSSITLPSRISAALSRRCGPVSTIG